MSYPYNGRLVVDHEVRTGLGFMETTLTFKDGSKKTIHRYTDEKGKLLKETEYDHMPDYEYPRNTFYEHKIASESKIELAVQLASSKNPKCDCKGGHPDKRNCSTCQCEFKPRADLSGQTECHTCLNETNRRFREREQEYRVNKDWEDAESMNLALDREARRQAKWAEFNELPEVIQRARSNARIQKAMTDGGSYSSEYPPGPLEYYDARKAYILNPDPRHEDKHLLEEMLDQVTHSYPDLDKIVELPWPGESKVPAKNRQLQIARILAMGLGSLFLAMGIAPIILAGWNLAVLPILISGLAIIFVAWKAKHEL